MAVQALTAISRREAAERAARKEALAAEAAAKIAEAEAAAAYVARKRRELRECLRVDEDKSALKVVEKCDSNLFAEADEEGMTPLHQAAINGCTACIQAMLRRYDLDVKKATAGDSKGRTPLHHAAVTDGTGGKVCAALVKHCELGARDIDGNTALQLAQHWGMVEAATVLHKAEQRKRADIAASRVSDATEEQGPKSNPKDISHMAGISSVKEGRIDDARVIMSNMHWRFVNQTDADGNTALHLVAQRGHEDLCTALLSRDDFHGADVVNKDRATALHLAVGTRHIGCVRAIIDSGRFTAFNVRDALGRTALHLAALRADAEAYEAISAHKECQQVPDINGRSPAEYARERGLEVELPAPDVDL